MTVQRREYDLEERCLRFARSVIHFVNALPRTMANVEIGRQVIRAAGSVGANYIEANESLGKKDFTMRLKICRKEAKESTFWLRLAEIKSNGHDKARTELLDEARQLVRIFSAIIEKAQ